MEKSIHPTNVIIIKASIQSEWDNCNFAIVRLTGEYKQTLQQRLNLALSLKPEQDLYGLEYWDCMATFYNTTPDDDFDLTEFLNGNSWAFVHLTEEEETSFYPPENNVTHDLFFACVNGTGKYTATGKNTGEDLYTASFNIKDILA